jgi:hypothetical protein
VDFIPNSFRQKLYTDPRKNGSNLSPHFGHF